MKLFSKFISILFHPLLLPTYAVALIVVFNPYLFEVYGEKGQWVFVIRIFINTFIFPAIAIFLLKQLGFIKSFEVEEREERIIPYITTATFYVWAYVSFRKSSLPQVINISLLGACITMFACFFANIISKISIHAAGIGCFAVIMLYNSTLSSFNLSWMLLATILLAGIIGTSRLYLNSHGLKQVAAGYIVGIASQMLALRFF